MEKKLWWNNRETMKLPSVTIKQLLEAGVHLGGIHFWFEEFYTHYRFGSNN